MEMALAKNTLIFLTMMSLTGVSIAAVFNVGDAAGWTSTGNVSYRKWAHHKLIYVGDTLVFKYNNQFHNVMQVGKEHFHSCNANSPIATYVTGADSIGLEKPGHNYFLCGFPGHCQAGQKVKIMVRRARAALCPSASPPSNQTTPTMGSPPYLTVTPGSISTDHNTVPSLSSSKFNLALGVLAFCLIGFAL